MGRLFRPVCIIVIIFIRIKNMSQGSINFPAKVFTIVLLWLSILISLLISSSFDRYGNLGFSVFSTLLLCVFFLSVEYSQSIKIHPIQYLLALCTFPITTLMFNGIMVYLSFDLSYIISSLALILLIAFYSTSFFLKVKTSGILTVLLSLSYLIYYVIVVIPDAGLLVGSISAFILLACIMYSTRNTNFYKQNESNQKSMFESTEED